MTGHVETLPLLRPQTRAVARFSAWLREYGWLVGWWLAGRAVVIVTAYVVNIVGPSGYLKGDLHAHPLGLLASWDGRWYQIVASRGYLLVPGSQSDPAFFPLFPLLLRWLHALGIGYATAGILISNLALVAALFAFHALSRELVGATLARRATTYVAIFPLGYVFSMAYPESIVLGLIALAAFAALRDRWILAAVCAGAASLARPEGLFVALPLLAIAVRRRQTMTPLRRGLALGAVAAPAAGLAAYPLYLAWVLHDPLAWNQAQQAWGRHFSPVGFVHAFAQLPQAVSGNVWVVRDVVCLFLYLGLIAVARRAGVPRAWLMAALAIVALPVFSGTFDSIGRFGLLAPPIFWGLATLGRPRIADTAIRVISIALLIAATVTIPFMYP
ncbi:MAG: hypothetical protein ABSB24_11520 [Gaiellaceae bacterium]